MEHLPARGITCPQPVKNRAGAALGKIAGRPAAIVTFLDGMWIRRPSAGHCAAVGEALAQLHLAGADFPLKRPTRCRSRAGGRCTSMPGARADRCSRALRLIEQGARASGKRLAGELPQGVIHADLFPDNVFFLGDKLSGLIDFYFACTDMLAYDIASASTPGASKPDHSYNVTKGRALLESLRAKSARSRLPSETRCPSSPRRRAAFPADAAGRLAERCRRARWCGRRIRSNITASCASPGGEKRRDRARRMRAKRWGFASDDAQGQFA